MRIASALERGGERYGGSDSGGDATVAAIAAVAALVATAAGTGECPVGSEAALPTEKHGAHVNGVEQSLALLPPLLAGLEARVSYGTDPVASDSPGVVVDRREFEELRARALRLEYEVAALRAQAARRLDVVAREAATSRQEAEEGRAEAAALRQEVTELSGRLERGLLECRGSSNAKMVVPTPQASTGVSTTSACPSDASTSGGLSQKAPLSQRGGAGEPLKLA